MYLQSFNSRGIQKIILPIGTSKQRQMAMYHFKTLCERPNNEVKLSLKKYALATRKNKSTKETWALIIESTNTKIVNAVLLDYQQAA